ncbi:MAG: CoA transferase [Chloroflexi bacterium]|nr:CoA transferase [Chloroflexota bacterium]
MANRNKLGITLDLRSSQGMEAFLDLVRTSDVVVEGYSAGSMERLGVHYQALRQVRPDIVMVSMPGWGFAGPYKGYVTLGSGLDAYTGHWILRSYPDSDPSEVVSVFHTDATAALALVFAVVSALHYRNGTGKGQWIDMSQAEAFMLHLARPLMDYVMNGRVAASVGNRGTAGAQGVYRCSGDDSWVAISIRDDADWLALCRAMDDNALAEESRFGDVLSRLRHHDELDEAITRWTSRRDKYEITELLQQAGVPAGAVLDDADIARDPHLQARGFFQKLTHPVAGTHDYPGPIWQMGGTPASFRPANTLGQHNSYLLQELLGRAPEEVEAMEAAGVIGDTYAAGADVDARDRR